MKNVNLDKRRSHSTVRHLKNTDPEKFCMVCFPLSSLLCCILISSECVFIFFPSFLFPNSANAQGNYIYTLIRGLTVVSASSDKVDD